MNNSIVQKIDEALKQAVAETSVDRGLDLLFDAIDDALLEQHFEEVDHFLKVVSLEGISTVLMIGILGITHAAKRLLPSRWGYIDRCQQRLEANGETVERIHNLLRGQSRQILTNRRNKLLE